MYSHITLSQFSGLLALWMNVFATFPKLSLGKGNFDTFVRYCWLYIILLLDITGYISELIFGYSIAFLSCSYVHSLFSLNSSDHLENQKLFLPNWKVRKAKVRELKWLAQEGGEITRQVAELSLGLLMPNAVYAHHPLGQFQKYTREKIAQCTPMPLTQIQWPSESTTFSLSSH